jgi:hypothetical protein
MQIISFCYLERKIKNTYVLARWNVGYQVVVLMKPFVTLASSSEETYSLATVLSTISIFHQMSA